MRFTGFPRGTRHTPVPNPLFGPLLETIDDISELKCTLRAIWLLHKKKGYPRYLTSREVLGDRVLRVALNRPGEPSFDAIRRGMKSCVARGTFLALDVALQEGQQEIFFLNDVPGQRAVELIGQGDLRIEGVTLGVMEPDGPVEPKANIFELYEENIGMLTPLLSEQMVEAESTYPWSWIEEAFKIAVSRNVRNWRYIDAILRRWAAEGKDDGEPGRYPQKTPNTEGLVRYLRRRGRLPEP